MNARFMEPAQFARLVENFKTDGKMTGTVTVCVNGDGSLEILSGHHRTEAAIVAGFDSVDVVVITTPLSEERRTAIQLSHNSINGSDNQSLLAKMYEGLNVDAKKFSGLTDAVLGGLEGLTSMSVTSLKTEYEELLLSFLPDNKAALEKHLVKLDAAAKKKTVWTARFSDFDTLFDSILRVKQTLQVVNSAMALMFMAELANERLDQIDAEQQASDAVEEPRAA